MKKRILLCLVVPAMLVAFAATAGAQTTILGETFDAGALPAGWTADPDFGAVGWAVDATPATVGKGDGDGFSVPGTPGDPNPFGGTGSLNINDGSTYDAGSLITDIVNLSVTSPSMSVVGFSTVCLEFRCNYETEDTTASAFDLRIVEIIDASTSSLIGSANLGESGAFPSDGGATCSPRGSWHLHRLNITPPAGVTDIQIRYHFNTIDSGVNFYNGWFIDNFLVEGHASDTLAPDPPVLLAPVDAATLAAPASVALSWNIAHDQPCGDPFLLGTSNIASYDVEVATDVAFVGIVFTATTGSTSTTTTSLGVGTYFWHVRATDVSGNIGAFSAPFTFNLVAPFALPFAEGFDSGGVPASWFISPLSAGGVGWTFDAIPAFVGAGDGDGFAIPGTPVDANPFAGAGSANYNGGAPGGTTYDDGAANSGTLTTPPLDISAIGTNVLCLNFQCNYEGGTTSASFFDTRSVDVIDASSLAVIGSVFLGETGASTPNATCATQGSWHVHDLNITPGAGVTSIQVRYSMLGDITDGNFYNGWFVDNFSVDSVPDTVGPLAPVNVTPPDGSFLATGPVSLDWTDAVDDTPCGQNALGLGGLAVTGYDVEVATDAGFVTIVFSASGLPTSDAVTGALGVGTYFWHARGVDSVGNAGTFSATTSFILAAPVGLPLVEGFDAGAPVGWGISGPVFGVGWTFDALPATVGMGDGDGLSIPGTPGDVNPFAGAGSANYNGGAGGGTTFDNGGFGSIGTMTTPPIDLTGTVGSICLNFECNFETQTTGAAFFDTRTVEVLDGGSGTVLGTLEFGDTSFGAIAPITCSAMGTWHVHDLNVSPPPGVTTIQIRYRFDTVAAGSDFYNGWFIDSFTLDENADSTGPLAVTNLTPTDGTSLAAGPVTLDWTDGLDDGPCGVSTIPAGGIASYNVQVASDVAFTTIVFSASPVTSTATTGALGVGTYFWRARAVDRAGNLGAFSTTFTFNIVVAVATPYSVDFDAGSLPAGWFVTPFAPGGVGWAVDATPAFVGDGLGLGGTVDPSAFGGSGSSLNFNDDVDYDDGTGITAGQASSPVLDISTLGGTVLLSFDCNYETDTTSATFFDMRTVTVLDGGSGAVLGTRTFGSDGSGTDLCASMGFYHNHLIDLTGLVGASTAIIVRFDFMANGPVAPGDDLGGDLFSGWFIDNFNVTCGDATPPAPAVNTTPPDTSLVFCPPGVTLAWTAALDSSDCAPGGTIATYSVELDTTNPPVVPFTFATTVPGATLTALTPALPAGTYFWRVLATDAFGNSTYSAVTSFTVEAPLPPLAPDTLFVNDRANGAQAGLPGFVSPIIDQQPVYSAIFRDPNTIDSATFLHYQVSVDGTFATVDFDSGLLAVAPLIPKDARCLDLPTPIPLLRNTVYFWRIEMTDSSGFVSPFSAPQSFRIGDDFDFGVRHGSTHHGKRCYVATAAYGEGSGKVASLASFRSEVLERSGSGSAFSRWYATAGAWLSTGVTRTGTGGASVRATLTPLAAGAAQSGALALVALLAMLALVVAATRRL